MFFGRVTEWWDKLSLEEKEDALLEAIDKAVASSPKEFLKSLVKKHLGGEKLSTVELKRLKNILWRGELMTDGAVDPKTGVRVTLVKTVGEAYSASPITEKRAKKTKLEGTF